MSNFNKIQEFLTTGKGTEGQLLIPRQIHNVLIMAVDKNLIPRSEAALYFGPSQIPGSSVDVDLETADTLDVREVAEGTELPLDTSDYTSVNIKPAKYGVAIRVTRELMEDSKWNMVQMNINTAGKSFAENENSLVVTALDGAANTVAGGASVTISNVTRAMQYLEDADFTPSTFFVGMEVLNDLRNIDTFVEANKVGNTEMLEKGFLGTIYGLNVVRVSTNAGMTATSAYVTDKTQAYVIAEKRTVTVEKFDLPSYDMTAAALTQRVAVALLRSSAVAKITSS